jgi:PadR family transcriptional regulator PadR
MQDSFEQKLLTGWEDVYKKGQLTLWILLALRDGPKHMADIKSFIFHATNDLLQADDKSMYRALRRYADVEMIAYSLEPNESGPDRKIYSLTEVGASVLANFVKRNITDIFFSPSVRRLLEKS